MSYENLTRKQQELLRWMVLIAEGHPDIGEFRAMKDFVGRSSQMILYSPEGDEYTSDIDSLYYLQKENLIALKPEDSHTLSCSVRSLAFEAVRNNFQKPHNGSKNQQPSGIHIESLSVAQGGQVNIGVNIDEIKQIVNDPKLLETKVFDLTDKIVEEIKKSMQFEERFRYEQEIQELRKQLLSAKPEPSKIKGLFNTLGFFGDIEGSVSLMLRVWPYVYPLLMIALEKVQI